jgi:DNA-binding transcriptional ArsR family regulator
VTLKDVDFAVGDERRRLRALSHPVRLRILSLLTDSPKSGTELGPELSMSQAAVSYHLRSLAAAGMIELDEVRSVRGGREKRYRLAEVGHVTGTRRDLEANVVAVTTEILRRIEAFGSNAWDVFGDIDIWLDEETWQRNSHAITDSITELHAAAKPAGTPGTVHVSATALLFSDRVPTRKRRPRKQPTQGE